MKPMQYVEIHALPHQYNVPTKHITNLKIFID